MDLFDLHVVRANKVYGVAKDHNGVGHKEREPGTVFIHGLYPDSRIVDGFDHFKGGIYDAAIGTGEAASKMLYEHTQLAALAELVVELQTKVMQGSKLLDVWGGATPEIEQKRAALRSVRGCFRNEHKRQLDAMLNSIDQGLDQRGRKNLAARMVQAHSALKPIRVRMVDVARIRGITLERSEDCWGEVDNHLAAFKALLDVVSPALFRKPSKERYPAGALVAPNAEQSSKLGYALHRAVLDLKAVTLKPFVRVRTLCERDAKNLLERLGSQGSTWTSDADEGFTKARELGFKLYTACRAVRVHDDLERERYSVGLNLPWGSAPEIVIQEVHAACDLAACWLSRVPDEADLSLEHPFKVRTSEALRLAIEQTTLLKEGVDNTRAGLDELKQHLKAACHVLMYGEAA